METHPGHEFDFAAAKLLWKSTNVLESKYVESSCIQTLPNCNTQAGEVTVNSILASMIMKVTNISKLAKPPRSTARPQRSSLYPSPPSSSAPLLAFPAPPSTPVQRPPSSPVQHPPFSPVQRPPSPPSTPTRPASQDFSRSRSYQLSQTIPSTAPQLSARFGSYQRGLRTGNVDSPQMRLRHRK